jgi:hypothetical protein
MLNHLRLCLRRIFPSVRVDVKILGAALRKEVLKRELVEGEEAELAAALVKKAIRAAARAKLRAVKAAVPKTLPAASPLQSLSVAPIAAQPKP